MTPRAPTATCPNEFGVTQLALALDVVCDAPTVRECADLMRELREIALGDVWQSGEYRVERDDVTGCDTVRFLRGSHVRGEWVCDTTNRLAAALRAIRDELVGTGITTGWLRRGALCEDAESGSDNLCYDAFEKFIQEGLWRTQAVTCISSVGIYSWRGISPPLAGLGSSTVISRARVRKYSTRSAIRHTGATCGASDFPIRRCVRAERTPGRPGYPRKNSRSTNRRRMDLTATVGVAGRNWRTPVVSGNWRSRARKSGSGNVRVAQGKSRALLNKMNHR